MATLENSTPATVRFGAPSEVPLPHLEGSGLAISVTPANRADGTRTLRVVGVCACSADQLPPGRLPLEAVWIVATLATRPPVPVSFSVAGDALVFADDHQQADGRVRAVFDLDTLTFEKAQDPSGVQTTPSHPVAHK